MSSPLTLRVSFHDASLILRRFRRCCWRAIYAITLMPYAALLIYGYDTLYYAMLAFSPFAFDVFHAMPC